jgi:hypothetical protein
VGLSGHLYWYSLWPLHEIIFRGLINGIARDSGCLQAGAKLRRVG